MSLLEQRRDFIIRESCNTTADASNQERRSRERYNCCVAEAAPMPIGKFFEEEENK